MARYEFKLPDIGEGVAEGEVVAWADGISVGSSIKADQPLVEVMTDKATVMITSPKDGTIVELAGAVGTVVPVGKILAVLEVAAQDNASAEPSSPAPQPSQQAPTTQAKPQPHAVPASKPATASAPQASAATAVGDILEDLPGMDQMPQGTAQKRPTAHAQQQIYAEHPLAAPATRKLARDLGVDLRTVKPSGPSGRVTQDDVRNHASATAGQTTSPTPPRSSAEFPVHADHLASAALPTAKGPPPAASSHASFAEQRVPLRGVRKRIFDAMARSKHTAAHFTFVEECDVSALIDLRQRLRPLAEAQGVDLSYLPFIVKACVASLKKHPKLNAAYDEATNEIVFKQHYNIGLAVATDAGLMVPVVKNADALSILEIAKEIDRLSSEARSGKAKLEDLQGSTFTITSLGAQGGLFATPVLNYPEVGILGVHQIKQKPVVKDGEIRIGNVMLLSLSFDHRLVDGHVGAAFAYEVIGYLENPDKLMLHMS